MDEEIEVIPRAIAERLDAHTKVIRKLIVAQRRGTAEHFGYAFLAGRALLQAKAIVPNGNCRRPNTGFRKWVVANFQDITLRTAQNWMSFAESIMARAHVDAPIAPLLLGSAELTGQSQAAILELVPEVMDGRGMVNFMRNCRLLREIKRRRRKKPATTDTLSCTSVSAPARRVWENIITEVQAGEKLLSHVESATDLNRYFGVLAEASDKIRALLKDLKRVKRG